MSDCYVTLALQGLIFVATSNLAAQSQLPVSLWRAIVILLLKR